MRGVRRAVRAAVVLLVAGAGAVTAAGQFRSGVDAVELYVSVVDAKHQPVSTLARDAFTVREDGRPQAISVFAAGDVPLALALAVDRSFSVAGARLAAMKAGGDALAAALQSSDQLLLLAIGSQVDVLAPLGTDRAAQRQALRAVDAFGSTSLHDAIVTAIDRIQEAPGRRVLVLLSDGVDRYSRTTAAAVVAHARSRDVMVFPVAVGVRTPALFVQLAAVTGGRALEARDPSRLGELLRALAAELRAQYLIGYVPLRPDPETRTWRQVQVSVAGKDLVARTRAGYWSGKGP